MSVGGVRASGGVGVLDDEVVDKMQILWWWWRKMKREEDENFKCNIFAVDHGVDTNLMVNVGSGFISFLKAH
ncbi:hypothetical protein F2Q69_00015340 [Brassica cretica]|uniref:Uncharacterized protein n=1 Tax=Brassica cretica TaxID=69181 RepID=A0A8S9QW80_BRACR|nr:hypothetical protein F2Q69_00015340 [Brassica cretica]